MESLFVFGALYFVLTKIDQYKTSLQIKQAMRKQAETEFHEYQREDTQETSDLLVLNDADSIHEFSKQNEGYLPYIGDHDFLFGPNNEGDHHNLVDTYCPPTLVPDQYELHA